MVSYAAVAVIQLWPPNAYYRPLAAAHLKLPVMTRPTASVASDIATFVPLDGNWIALDTLLAELWQTGHPEQAIPELLSVFERYPDEDGAGVVWGVLHGLESLPNYEPELLRSLARQPSEFGIRMLGRLLNAGVKEVAGASLLNRLQEISASTPSPTLAKAANGFIARSA